MWSTKLHSDALANWSFWLMMIGGLGFFVTLWLGGFWQGWQWNNPAIPFIDTVVALKPVWLVRFFSGTLIFCWNLAVRLQHHGDGDRGGRAARKRRAGGVEETSMLSKADRSASFAAAAALALFFIGGLLTTVVPPLVDKSWGRPFENHDPSKGPPASW